MVRRRVGIESALACLSDSVVGRSVTFISGPILLKKLGLSYGSHTASMRSSDVQYEHVKLFDL